MKVNFTKISHCLHERNQFQNFGFGLRCHALFSPLLLRTLTSSCPHLVSVFLCPGLWIALVSLGPGWSIVLGSWSMSSSCSVSSTKIWWKWRSFHDRNFYICIYKAKVDKHGDATRFVPPSSSRWSLDVAGDLQNVLWKHLHCALSKLYFSRKPSQNCSELASFYSCCRPSIEGLDEKNFSCFLFFISFAHILKSSSFSASLRKNLKTANLLLFS